MHFNLTFQYTRASVEVSRENKKKNCRNSTSRGRSTVLNLNETMVAVQMRSNYVDSGEN